MKNTILFIAILFVFGSTMAQENFVEGFIIKNTGDTVHGLINYQYWTQNPTSIEFKTDRTKDASKYSSNEIKRFYANNALYVGKTVTIENSPTHTSKLTKSTDLILETRSVFLQVLYEGEKSLYLLRDQSKSHYFIFKNDSIQPLIYKKYFKLVNGIQYVTPNNKYIGQLLLYLDDCPTLKNKINGIEYKKKHFENIFRDYYLCKGKSPNFRAVKDKVSLSYGAFAGLSHTNLNFSGSQRKYLTEADFSASLGFTAGLAFNLHFPIFNNRFSIFNELQYTGYTTEGEHIEEDLRSYKKTNSEFEFEYIRINNLISFTLYNKGVNIYTNIGLTNGFTISDYDYKYVYSRYGISHISEYNSESEIFLEGFRKYEQGLIFGSGIKYKSINVELRYEISNGMSNYTGLKSAVSRTYLLAAYTF